MHDDEHRTVEDIEAELIVAGCIVASPLGADLAAQRLTAEHFTRPYLRDLFDIGPHLPSERPTFTDPFEPGLADQRATAASQATGVAAADVALLVSRRLTMVDGTGYYARRLQRAHARRTIASLLDDADTLVHADSDDLAGQLAAVIEAVGTHCEQLR